MERNEIFAYLKIVSVTIITTMFVYQIYYYGVSNLLYYIVVFVGENSCILYSISRQGIMEYLEKFLEICEIMIFMSAINISLVSNICFGSIEPTGFLLTITTVGFAQLFLFAVELCYQSQPNNEEIV